MTKRFYHYFKIVAFVHVAVLVCLLFSGFLFQIFKREEKDLIIPVEFIVAVPAETSRDNAKDHDIPNPKPKPDPKQETKPKPDPKKETKPKPKHEVKVNTERVRQAAGGTSKPEQLLSPEEIQKRLLMGAKPGDRNTNIPDEDMLGFTLVKQALYDAWIAPDKEAAGSSFVEVLIRLSLDGTLTGKRILKASGNSVMDTSVSIVLNSVIKIPGLSVGFLKRHNNEDITVTFRVE